MYLCCEEMNLINDAIVSKFKPDADTTICVADDTAFNPDLKFKLKKLEEFNPGCLPPHFLYLKKGCVLMLLRNWKLSQGIHMNYCQL